MRKIETARLIASEMMQQWFDNLVSPSWWSYLWLNDGIAMLFGMEVLNKVFYTSFHIFYKFSSSVKNKM